MAKLTIALFAIALLLSAAFMIHRVELIQDFPKCTEGHARRLYDIAWLPLFDEFYLDSHHSIAWEHPRVPGTPWRNAFFLLRLIKSHRNFVFEVEGDKVSFLWHIPISDANVLTKRSTAPTP